MKDRHEEALVALKKFRGEGNELSAETELELIRASLAEETDSSAIYPRGGNWSSLCSLKAAGE